MKKRVLSIVLVVAMLCALLPHTAIRASAAAYKGSCGDDLKWSYDVESRELTITGSGDMYDYDSSAGSPWYPRKDSILSVVIGSGATSIGSYAFYECSCLTSINIPDSVVTVGDYAFRDCSVIKSINIPDSVTDIGKAAFVGCQLLTDVSLGSGITSIAAYLFSGCRGIKSAVIPDSVTSIEEKAFGYCTGLTSVTIGSGVASIGNSAFISCTGLTGINIPDSVTSIGDYAFSGCAGLTSVTIGDGVTSIGGSAFYGCTGLTGITIPDAVTSIGDSAFCGCSGLTGITIPDAVTSIGNSVFGGCAGLAGITIPDGVTSIGGYAFSGCTGLASITIPDTVASMGAYAFYNCAMLTSVNIPDGVTSIGDYAFYGCAGLTSVTVPDGVTSIGGSAFYGCTGLTSVTIGDGVTSIGGSAFEGCAGLTGITIPDGVTSIGDYAFSGCTRLASITIPDGVTSIGGGAFYNTAYYNKDSNWRGGVLYIGSCLINAKSDITIISIKDGTRVVADNTFYSCAGLTGITFPDTVTSIGDYAFFGCTGLTRVAIPDGATSIGGGAFRGCAGLLSIIIPVSVASIGIGAFEGCTGLIDVFFGGSESRWLEIGMGANDYGLANANIHFADSSVEETYSGRFNSRDITWSLNVDTGVLTVSGSGVIDEHPWAFYKKYIKTVNIGSGITGIGANEFREYTEITGVTLPDTLTVIQYQAFYGCTGLAEITIPDSVTDIGIWAFYGCTGLKSVTVGKGMEHFNDSFYDCLNIEYLYYNSKTIPSWFRQMETLKTVELGGNVSAIGLNAFYDCTGMTSIIIPESVTEIADRAFSGCSGLKEVGFRGSKEQWDNIEIGEKNGALTRAAIIFNYIKWNAPTYVWADDNSTCTATRVSPEDSTRVETETVETVYAVTEDPTETKEGAGVFTASFENEAFETQTKEVKLDKPAPKVEFKDVPADAFYAEAVQWAVAKDITNGTGEGTFSPNNKCTRGQVVTFLWRAAGSPEPKTKTNPFTDVKESGFYFKAVLWAVENGVTSGLTATTFGPGKECTRGQVVTFLWRAKGSPAPTKTAHPFTDVAANGFYFKAMLWAVENEVTNGTTATTFGPNKTCTRGQVVTFLYRAFK